VSNRKLFTLREICQATQGVQIAKNFQSKIQKKGFKRYFYISDFKHDKNIKYVEDIYPKKKFTSEDLIVSNTGSHGLVFTGKEGILSNNLFKVSFDNKIINKFFLLYFLESSLFKDFQSKRVRGTANPHMGHENFLNTPISLPQLSEQERIVAKLDSVFAEIDKLDKFTFLKIKNIKSLFESILHKYFTDDKYKKIKIKDVCTATQGVQISKNNHLKLPKKGYLRYLYISDFSNNKNIKYVKNEFPKKIVKLSDIIVVNTGASAGNIFRGIEGILSNNLFKVQPDKSLIEPDFLYYFVTSNLFKNFQKKIMRGTANPHMGHENFLSVYLNLPPLNKQKEIVSIFFELNKNVENLNQNYLNKINSLKELKSKLLSFKSNNTKAA